MRAKRQGNGILAAPPQAMPRRPQAMPQGRPGQIPQQPMERVSPGMYRNAQGQLQRGNKPVMPPGQANREPMAGQMQSGMYGGDQRMPPQGMPRMPFRPQASQMMTPGEMMGRQGGGYSAPQGMMPQNIQSMPQMQFDHSSGQQLPWMRGGLQREQMQDMMYRYPQGQAPDLNALQQGLQQIGGAPQGQPMNPQRMQQMQAMYRGRGGY